MSTQIKVCCISSKAEAFMAMSIGAEAIGLVSHMPSGPGVISDKKIKSIIDAVGNQVNTFLLTSFTEATDIIDQHKRLPTTTIQLVDTVEFDELKKIKATLPHIRIVQVIHVIDQGAIQQSVDVAPLVDGLLLDSGNPNSETKILGGTGKVHDWNLSKEIVKSVSRPVFLAGGLDPSNVNEAINFVRPFGVDLCSGVRSNNKLDEVKLVNFIEAVNG